MRRGDYFIRLVTAVLFLAVASYIGLYIYNAAKNPFQTATAEAGEYSSSVKAQGYVIRSEQAITGGGGAMTPAVGEGEKVAAGALVANGYSGQRAFAQADEVRALRLQIEQLESQDRSAASAAAGAYTPALDAATALSRAVQRSAFDEIESLCMLVENVIFTEPSASADALPALRARLDALEAEQTGQSGVYAPASGVFSSSVDGFERVGPEAIGSMRTPSALAEAFSYAGAGSGAAGKLITGITWYYAAVIDSGAAAELTAGKDVDVGFTGSRRVTFTMRLDEVYAPEEGRCVAVFSCRSGIGAVASMRYSEADVALGSVSGLLVPRQAIRLSDDGRTYVYVYSGGRARMEYADILGEFDDMYIVRDGAAGGSPLRVGAEIIVKANGLYDGKVIRR
ncbi:MAG: hypothetical protein LBJ84_01625 [Oscillospiraceae bacterium]|jgi:multidrug efflux pump subunit AcrA (membrane-fusion protein)|nr:hypothetical protein [Oscillospiraceae bacterium]